MSHFANDYVVRDFVVFRFLDERAATIGHRTPARSFTPKQLHISWQNWHADYVARSSIRPSRRNHHGAIRALHAPPSAMDSRELRERGLDRAKNKARQSMKTKKSQFTKSSISQSTPAAPVAPNTGLKRFNLAGIATTSPAAKATILPSCGLPGKRARAFSSSRSNSRSKAT